MTITNRFLIDVANAARRATHPALLEQVAILEELPQYQDATEDQIEAFNAAFDIAEGITP